MKPYLLSVSLAVLTAGFAFATDPYCPMYPAAERAEVQGSLALEQLTSQFAARPGKGRLRSATARKNFIDDHIFGKMEEDGVAPAPVSSDAEFLRRVSIDLTGRIPTVEAAAAFLNDTDP